MAILVLVETGGIADFPHLIDLNEPFFMLYGPLLFLYARNQAHQRFLLKKSDILALIPFVLALFVYIPDLIQTPENKLTRLRNEGNTLFDVGTYIWEWIFYLTVNMYFLLRTIRELRKYDTKLKEQLSNIAKSNLHPTLVLVKVCLVLYLIELLFVYFTYYGFPYYHRTYLYINLLSGIVLMFVSVDAILSHRYIIRNQLTPTLLPVKKENEKYASSGLTKESSEEIRSRLIRYMEDHRPYLQPQLRIKELSDATGIPTHHLSQVLNESFEQNFYEFINGYRIKEAMKILKDPNYQNYTYEAIAFEVGFNSRSAFYNAFKKINNTTPSKL
ncbi:helix-turn-helix domain-containing protein [Sediminicola luteus]|nr:AraC family transcriptional regulator [Sediminicola luteus]